MKVLQVKSLFPFVLLFLASARPGVADVPFSLRMEGNRISLRAEGVPLRDVLEAFAAYGVTVHAQSNLQGLVHAQVHQEDLNETLKKILGDYNHITTWTEYPYANGTVSVLSSIRVFNPERVGDPMLPLPAADMRVQTLPDGTRVVADEVLIGMKPGTSPAAFRAMLARVGGQVVDVDPRLGIYRVRLPANSNLPDVLERLQGMGGLAVAEPNLVIDMPPPHRTGAGGVPAAPRLSLPPLPPGAPALAILDSGLDPAWLAPEHLRGSRDITQPERGISDPNGHGTQMALIGAGLITPAGATERTDAVPIVAIRGFDAQGRSTSFGLLESMNYAHEQGAGVMSMSWGSETSSDILAAAFDRAARAGMLFLAAAGNEGHEVPMYPAAYPGVIAVGAMTAEGTPWAQSNRGDHVAFLSYGTATFPVGHDGPPGTYAGTSIATPWVAAAITAYQAQHPQAQSADVLTALLSALSPHAEGTGDGYGAGIFDAAARDRFMQTPPKSNGGVAD